MIINYPIMIEVVNIMVLKADLRNEKQEMNI